MRADICDELGITEEYGLGDKNDAFSGEALDWTEAEKIFAKVKEEFMVADVSDVKEHLAYQFNIEGEAGGIFYVEVKDGVLSVEPYEYYDRDAMFTASAEVLMKIASGKLDPIVAVTLQKLKVEGNIEKALKLKEFIDKKKKK